MKLKNLKPYLWPVLAGLMLLAILVSGFRITGAESDLFNPARSDFDDYHKASILLRQGEDPYQKKQFLEMLESKIPEEERELTPENILKAVERVRGVGRYLYLPFFAFILTPLSYLSYETASVIFQLLSFVSLCAFFYLYYRRRVGNLRSDFETDLQYLSKSVFFAGLILLSFLIDNAANGNIGFFIIFLCGSGFLLSFRTARPLLQILGGALIGIAVVMKIMPVFLAGALFAFRRFTALWGVAAGIAFGLLLPVTGLGINGTIEVTSDWYEVIINTYSQLGVVRPWANNQTISAAMSKFLIPGSDFKQIPYGLPVYNLLSQPDGVQVLAASVRTLNMLLIAFCIGMCLWTAWYYRAVVDGPWAIYRKKDEPADTEPESVETLVFNPVFVKLTYLLILASLVTSGVSWYHAYSMLLLAVFPRFLAYFEGERFKRIEVYYLLPALFGAGFLLIGSGLQDLLSLYSVFTFLVLALIAMCAVDLIRTIRRYSEGRPGGI